MDRRLSVNGILFICFFAFKSSALWSQKIPITSFETKTLFDEEELIRSTDSTSTLGLFFNGRSIFQRNVLTLNVLPVRLHSLTQQTHPVAHLNGSLQRAAGTQFQLSTGIFLKWKFLKVQLLPELNKSVNPEFIGFNPGFNSTVLWGNLYNWFNRIDVPETNIYQNSRLYPGQSYLSLEWDKLEFRISTENKFWGPGKYDALLFSNNAPGFLHFNIHSNESIHTIVGDIDFEWLTGQLENSNVLPADTSILERGSYLYYPKEPYKRFLSAININFKPSILKGLEIGFSNSVQQYAEYKSLNDFFGGLSSVFSKYEGPADNVSKQQLQSFYISWKLEESHAKLYIEGLIQKPGMRLLGDQEIPRNKKAWLAGVSKFWPINEGKGWLMDLEFTQLEQPTDKTLTEGPGIYTDPFIRHGFTHYGENLGSSLYTGSNRQTFSFGYRSITSKYSFLFQRINNNNDYYFYMFSESGDFRRNWIDMILGIQYFNLIKNTVGVNMRLNYIYTLNYYWEHDLDVEKDYFAPGLDIEQLQGVVSLAYKF
jgi:hypothetical protein